MSYITGFVGKLLPKFRGIQKNSSRASKITIKCLKLFVKSFKILYMWNPILSKLIMFILELCFFICLSNLSYLPNQHFFF